MTKEDVANAFHVPLSFLTSSTNLANLQAAEQQHMARAISPRLRRRDQKINEALIPLYDPSGRLFVASEDPVPYNQEIAWRQQEVDLKFGIVTINEVRQDRGLPPVAWGDTPWLPLNWAPTMANASGKEPHSRIKSAANDGSRSTGTPDQLDNTCRDSSSVSRLAVNSRAPNQAPTEVSRVVINSRERGDSATNG